MTEKVYLRDSYLREIESVVTSSDGNMICLDRTIFYPRGGGQPSDSGTIVFGEIRLNLLEVSKEGEEVVHIADHDGPPVGSRVKCILDWENRYACMRMHTAIHMLDAVFTKTLGTLGLSTGSQIYRDRARVDFSTESISRRDAEDLVERTNIEIRKDHEVKAYEISREEALSIEGLARTRPGYELIRKLETVRIVDIVGLDRQADGGTHVSRTSEIGIMTFLKFESKGRNNKRVYFTLDEP
ncbi:MAG: alanyl-tRNA editing protein [Candidatus Thermoplasmatota archaeon]|nr:alanyl-tRNA editing protein [Candidatus Thermoplasmatota archaeon]